jgi:hypothetical protein
MEKRFDFPGIWIYNIIMLKIKDREVGEGSKIDNKIVVNLFGEGNCRGDRWIERDEEEVDLNKVVKFYENSDDGWDCERGIELNDMEGLILRGSDFVEEEGFDNCLERVEKLLNGESFMVEFEESVVCIGNKSRNEVEVDFCKGKIELLKA